MRSQQTGVSSKRLSDRLLIAAIHGQIDVVKSLLDDGVNVNGKNSSGTTALIFATHSGHTKIVTLK